MTNIQASVHSKPYKVSYIDPIHTPKRKLSVICIGAGASGLLLAYKLDRHFDDFDLTIYEKNADTGGTWFENRYPGFV
jgi:cyclohexanone monooxygenase